MCRKYVALIISIISIISFASSCSQGSTVRTDNMLSETSVQVAAESATTAAGTFVSDTTASESTDITYPSEIR